MESKAPKWGKSEKAKQEEEKQHRRKLEEEMNEQQPDSKNYRPKQTGW